MSSFQRAKLLVGVILGSTEQLFEGVDVLAASCSGRDFRDFGKSDLCECPVEPVGFTVVETTPLIEAEAGLFAEGRDERRSTPAHRERPLKAVAASGSSAGATNQLGRQPDRRHRCDSGITAKVEFFSDCH